MSIRADDIERMILRSKGNHEIVNDIHETIEKRQSAHTFSSSILIQLFPRVDQQELVRVLNLAVCGCGNVCLLKHFPLATLRMIRILTCEMYCE